MPISTCSSGSREPDTYSLISQATSTRTIGDSLPAQLVRKTARKGFTFNVMLVGPPDMGKTTLLSALFGKNLEITNENIAQAKDSLNPNITIATKTFEIEEKRVRLKLRVAESEDYGEALCLRDTHIPLVDFINMQFADYHRRESSNDRRNIRDKMIHCLFFFISPFGHGLSRLDLEFLKSVHDRVNIVPIIGRAEALTTCERAAFKRRVKDDLNKHHIQVYQLSDPDPEDPDYVKKEFKEIQEAMPFAVSSMTLRSDNSIADRCLDWGQIDSNNLNHSDFLLLKAMLHMQLPDLCEITHEVFYEEYRLKMKQSNCSSPQGCVVKGPTKVSTYL